MKYLLTLLSLCSLAYASDSHGELLCLPGQANDALHQDMNIPSPLRRASTPLLSKSLSVMPSINQVTQTHAGFGHHRNRSKSHITEEPAISDDSICSTSVPIASFVPSRSSSMLHPLGAHRTGILPQTPSVQPISQAEDAEELRIQELRQLRKDKTDLEEKLARWREKQNNAKLLAEVEKRMEEVEGRFSSHVSALGSVAVDIAAIESGELMKKTTTLLTRIDTLLQQQAETQKQQAELCATVKCFIEQLTASKISPDTSSSKEKKPISARLSEFGSMFSVSKTTLRPNPER